MIILKKTANHGKLWKIYINKEKIRAIGVSNFKEHHIDELLETCEIKPMVNQIEFHPSCLQKDIRDYCKQRNIVVVGYSPLANGKVFQCEELKNLCSKI